MPSQRNQQLLAEVQDKVNKAVAMYFVDYQGLTHLQLEEARRELRKNNSEVAVTKNTLMRIALKEKGIDATEQLNGPYATLFSYEDPISTAKVLKDFFKKYNLQVIKFGIFEGAIVDDKTVEQLANIPPKEVLIGKLVGLLASPYSKLVWTLNGNIQKLAMVLKAIEEKKGASN
jgi:large subunit ribosomal protein L10